MKYKNSDNFQHHQADKIGVLLSNLGTPEAPTAKALKPYLKQFLSDPRVVEVPRLLWWCILNGIILRTRPKRSAEAYASVWTEEGSPLSIITRQQAEKVRAKLQHQHPSIDIAWAMRYGKPAIAEGIQTLIDNGARKILVLPLYPQYSAATVASTFDALAQDFTHRRWLPELRFINSYHDYSPYLKALSQSIEQHWETHGKPQKLIFSYHGVPLRYLHNGDPYHCQCLKTSRLIAEHLGLNDDEHMTTFQSRFGKEEWLKPYTDDTMKSLPKQGIKSVQVICPGFSADCLETIEEIGEENREYFIAAGGEQYTYIPALNDSEPHIEALCQLIQKNLQGWLDDPTLPITPTNTTTQDSSDDQTAELIARAKRAEQCPYNKPST
ncbi:Ferrochelatase [Thalassocella blandensis]|nr:Ferrochelatase [Thalassocella blandensis]